MSARNYYNLLVSPSVAIPDVCEIAALFGHRDVQKVKWVRSLWIEPYHIGRYLTRVMGFETGDHYLFYPESTTIKTAMSRVTCTPHSFYKTDVEFVQDSNVMGSKIRGSKLPVVVDDGHSSYCVYNHDGVTLLIDPHISDTFKRIGHIRAIDNLPDFIGSRVWMIYIPKMAA